MCDVRPFRGLRYSLQGTRDLSAIIAPPYDVISDDDRSEYYRRSPYNVVRLESGEEQRDDSPENNKYTRAAATLAGWLHEGVLLREKQPSFYVIEHRFRYQDVERSRWCLVATARLEDFGGQIRPHERTTSEPEIDRLHLLRACRANTSPIMGLVRSESGEMLALLRDVGSEAPDASATDGSGVSFHLRVVAHEPAIAGITRFLADKAIYIADGHHRYETALHYRDEQKGTLSSAGGDEPFDFVMMSLMDSQDPGIVMLPLHRMVRGMEPQRIARLDETIAPYFHVEELPQSSPTPSGSLRSWLATLRGRGESATALGIYGLHGQKFHLLTLRRDADLRGLMTEEELTLWNDCDVVLLQRVILGEGLGIDPPETEARYLEYTSSELEARTRVDSGECQLAFFLNPGRVASVLDTADAGRRLPRKSTNFYPKTPAGLVINPVSDEA